MTTEEKALAPLPLEDEFALTEVIKADDPIVAIARELFIEESELPLHEQYLTGQSLDVQEHLANLIYGADSIPLSEFVGKEVPIHGLFIYEQKQFYGKDQKWHPGYFQTRLLIADTSKKGEPIIVAHTSSKGVFMHAVHILKNRGWFLFEKPITYRVVVGKNNAQHIYNVEHDLKKRASDGK